MSQWESKQLNGVSCVFVWGGNEIACMHAIQPDNNINLPVFEWGWMHAYVSVSVCVLVWDRMWESVLMACVCVTKCVSLLDRCVSQPQVRGRGSNSCPSPCRWQPAEQHQSLLDPNLSLSLAVSVAAAAAALTVSAGWSSLTTPLLKAALALLS